jgi:acyl carrier protein
MTLPILIDLLWLDKSYDERLVDLNSGLVADLGADSLDNVEILDEMKDKLAKKRWVKEGDIPDEDAENMFTVWDAIAIVSKQLEKQLETI